MKNDDGEGGEDSGFANGESTGGFTIPSRLAVNRRSLLGGFAALVGSHALAGSEGEITFAWNPDINGWFVGLPLHRELVLLRSAFVDDVKPHLHMDRDNVEHVRLVVSPARRLQRDELGFEMHFRRKPGQKWRFSVTASLLPGRTSTSVEFAEFLNRGRSSPGSWALNERPETAEGIPGFDLSQQQGQRLLDRAFGANVAVCGARTKFALLPNLSWTMVHAEPGKLQPILSFVLLSARATSLRLGFVRSGTGPCLAWAPKEVKGAGDPSTLESFAAVFHGLDFGKEPLSIGRRDGVHTRVELNKPGSAAIEQWHVKNRAGTPTAQRVDVFLVRGAGSFDVHHHEGRGTHIDGKFNLDLSDLWWTRGGHTSWRVATRLVLADKPFKVRMSFGILHMQGGSHARPVTLSEGPQGLILSGQASIIHVPRQVKGTDFSRLDLSRGIVELQLPNAADETAINPLVLGRNGSARIPLDCANLKVSRAKDLLALNLRFQHLDLLLQAKSTAIVLRGAGLRAKVPSPLEPLLIVDFPPQHVAEEAIYRVLPDAVSKGDPEAPILLPNVLVNAPAIEARVKAENTKLSASELAKAVAEAIEKTKKERDPDYAEFAKAYDDKIVEMMRGGRSATPREPGQPFDRPIALEVLNKIQADKDNHQLPPLTRARLAGPTRLAFEVPTGRQALAIPFSIDALTNFGEFDLKVVRRATRYVPPEDPNVDRPLSTAKELAIYGFEPFLASDKDGTRWDQRMRKIRDLMAEPKLNETSIELPARLMLSPDNKARWRVPHLRSLDDVPYGHVPLWRMQLEQPKENGPQVRAIWSPDFEVGVFGGTAKRPERGIPKGWFRTAMDAYDRHEIVALSSLHGLPVLPRLRTDGKLDGGQFAPPDGFSIKQLDPGRIDINPLATDEAIYRPRPLKVDELTLTAIGGSFTMNSPFEPPAGLGRNLETSDEITFSVERWRHEAVLGRDVVVEVVYKGFLFPIGHRCSLVKMTERRFLRNPAGGYPTAYLIQRMFLRIGTPDKVFPGRNHPDESRRWPLRNVKMLTEQTPDIVDPTNDTQRGLNKPGRNGSLGQLDHPATNAVYSCKGLVFWPRTGPDRGREVLFKLEFEGSSAAVEVPLIFVDNLAAHDPVTIEALCNYYALHAADKAGAPMTDEAAQLESLVLVPHGGVPRRYANEDKRGSATYETNAWILGAEGRASVSANNLYVMDPFMEGADQPPFYPYIRRAEIRIKQLERLSGGGAKPVWAKYIDDYRRVGFKKANSEDAGKELDAGVNGAEVFLELLDETELSFSAAGDRSGGIAKPNVPITAISRSKGPMGAGIGKSAAGSYKFSNFHKLDPQEFFPKAKLLGIIEFKDILKLATVLTGNPQPFPEAKQIFDYGLLDGVPERLRNVLGVIEQWTNIDGEKWKSIHDKFATLDRSGGEPFKITVRDLLPGFAQALDNLHALLPEYVRKQQKNLPVEEQTKQILKMDFAGFYESGQRLLGEIEAIADDPVGPLKSAGRRVVSQLRSIVTDQIVPTGREAAFVRRAFAVAEDIDREVGEAVVTWLSGANARWRQLILGLVEPNQWPSGAPNVAALFFECLTNRIVGSPLPAVSPSNREARDRALHQLIERLTDRNRFEGDVEHCFSEVKSKIDEHFRANPPAAEFAAEISRIKSSLERRFVGSPEYIEYIEFLRMVHGLPQRLNEIIKRNPREFASEVIEELKKLLEFYKNKAVDSLGSILGDQLSIMCANATGLLLAFALTVIPEPPEGAFECVFDPNAPMQPPAAGDRRPLTQACVDIRNRLTQVANRIRALDDIAGNLPAEVAPAVRTEVARFLAARKAEAEAGLGRLITEASAAAKEINAVFHAWRLFVDNLRPEEVDDFNAWVSRKGREFCPDPPTATALTTSVKSFTDLLTTTSTSIAATVTALQRCYLELGSINASWNIASFADNAVRAALADAQARLSLEIARVGQQLQGMLAEQTSGFRAIPLGQPNRLRTQAREAFNLYITRLTQQFQAVGGVAGSWAVKLQTAVDRWRREPTLQRVLTEYDNFVVQVEAINTAISAAQNASSVTDRLSRLQPALTGIAAIAGYGPGLQRLAEQIKTLRTTSEAGIQENLFSIAKLRTVLWDEFTVATSKAMLPFLGLLSAVYGVVTAKRAEIQRLVNKDSTTKVFIKALSLENLFIVPRPAAGQPAPSPDQIDRESAAIDTIRARVSAGGALSQADIGALTGIATAPAIITLFKQVLDGADSILRLDIGQFIDFANIRKTIEDELKGLIPSKVTLKYDYEAKLEPHGAIEKIFKMWPDYADGVDKYWRLVGKSGDEKSENNLLIRANAQVDILKGTRSAIVEGFIQPFKITLLGTAFDVVTLKFEGASFKSVNGSKPRFKTNLIDTELGPEVEFLEDLQSWLNGGEGNGFFLRLITTPAFGVEAGYRFGLPIISIGTVSFSNVGLEAAVVLPFEDKDAVFRIALSSRDNPFLISAAPYGGGGHVALYANAKSIVGFEASFEFGGVAAFGFGPLTGIGRLTTGVFVSKSAGRGASIQGHFFAGGSARIWIFGMATSLTVRMGQANGGSMCGSAVYSFSFSYGIDDIEFKVPVWRQEDKGFGGEGGSRSDLFDMPGAQFAQAETRGSDVGPGLVGLPMPKADASTEEWKAWNGRRRAQLNEARQSAMATERARLNRVRQYGVRLVSHSASRDSQWRRFNEYFDASLVPEE